VVLHDIQNAALPRLPEFLRRLEDGDMEVEFRQDFPENVVLMRRGELLFPDVSSIVT
jgi:hypothetical protein